MPRYTNEDIQKAIQDIKNGSLQYKAASRNDVDRKSGV